MEDQVDHHHRCAIPAVRSMHLRAAIDGTGEGWTEERHSSFLNWIEESFVRRMLGGATPTAADRQLRLDRRLPDSATESNRDRRPPATDQETPEMDTARAGQDRPRKRPLERYDGSQDQVVPEFGGTDASSGEIHKKRKGRQARGVSLCRTKSK